MFKIEFEVRLNSNVFKPCIECFCNETIFGETTNKVVYNYLKHLITKHKLLRGKLYFKRYPKPTYIYLSQNHYILNNSKIMNKYIKVELK